MSLKGRCIHLDVANWPAEWPAALEPPARFPDALRLEWLPARFPVEGLLDWVQVGLTRRPK